MNNTYKIEKVNLESVNSFCDLGVLFDPKCSFNMHIDHIVNKGYWKLSSVIRWSREFNDINISKILYQSLVRQDLEYCSVLWCPHYDVQTKRIESLQKKFMLFVDNLNYRNAPITPYRERLQNHHLLTMEDRRIIQNVIFVFKIFCNEIDANFILENIKLNVKNRPDRNSNYKLLYERRCQNNYSVNEPITALCIDFNLFYKYVDFNLSPINVKKKLKNHFLRMYN